ncbi:MAG TPA: LysR family transcriptional regulator, partial [Burkholderiaceae bacterium]|nr:LysR family transcriptional regulator [Burkholderiaceae bacterium]
MTSNPRITLEQWQALVAVVEAGGYARAAERLHKSQSTLTYAVQRIESLLGVKAFELKGRRAQLTPTGQLLYRRARVLLQEAGGLEAAAERLSAGWEAEIRLAMEILFPTSVMLEALDRFNAESPHTQIELIESVLGGTAEALLQGQVDLAIAPSIPPGFAGEPLLRMRLIAVAHRDHPLHRLGRVATHDDLRAHRQLLVRESGSTRNTRPAFDASARWTVGQMSTSIEAARAGYGFAWIPEEKIRDELASGLLAPLALQPAAERYVELHLIFASRDTAGPGVLRLAQRIHETVRRRCASPSAEPDATGTVRAQRIAAGVPAANGPTD